MSKNIISIDFIEMISNQSPFSPSLPMITPSISLKLLWEKDKDFKFYTEQALSNFHDTYKLPMSSVKPGES